MRGARFVKAVLGVALDAALVGRLRELSERFRDRAEALSDQALAARLAEPSNPIGAQLWCVVGARESHSRAIEFGGWQVPERVGLRVPRIVAAEMGLAVKCARRLGDDGGSV